MHVMISCSGQIMATFALGYGTTLLTEVYLFIALIIYSLLIQKMMHRSGKPLPIHKNLTLGILSSVQDDCDSGSQFFGRLFLNIVKVPLKYPFWSFDIRREREKRK